MTGIFVKVKCPRCGYRTQAHPSSYIEHPCAWGQKPGNVQMVQLVRIDPPVSDRSLTEESA